MGVVTMERNYEIVIMLFKAGCQRFTIGCKLEGLPEVEWRPTRPWLQLRKQGSAAGPTSPRRPANNNIHLAIVRSDIALFAVRSLQIPDRDSQF
jgi:hypothetical protein